jgi:hypothetical protein
MLEAVNMTSDAIVSILRHFSQKENFLQVAREVSGRGPKIGRGGKK